MKEEICFVCRKIITNKTDIGLSKKFLGRNTKTFFCINCLADHLEVDVEFLLEKVEEFKQQGCTLF